MLYRVFALVALLILGSAVALPPAHSASASPCPTLCTPTPAPTPCLGTGSCPTPTPGPTPCLNSGSCPTPTALRDTDVTGTVEYQFTDDGPPHPTGVFKDGPWFGYAGARVYLSWADGDPEAVIYLPPPACQWTPLRACASVCPAPITCWVALSTYRRTSPTAEVRALVLQEVPFGVGEAGTPVRLGLPGDGTARWGLP